MKNNRLTFWIMLVGLSLLVSISAGDPVTPEGYGSPVKVFGVKVGTPDADGGTVRVEITMKHGGTNNFETRYSNVTLNGGETAAEKAEKIAAAAKAIIAAFEAEGTAEHGANGEVTIEVPAGLSPKVSIESKETGEEDKEMSYKEIKEFYEQVEPLEDEDMIPIEPRSIFAPMIVADDTTTNSYLNSIILKDIPMGTWHGVAGGTLNVSVGVDMYSTPTMGKTLDMLAVEIADYYTAMGYPIVLTGDATNGYYIQTGNFCPSVQGLDDGLTVGLCMEIDPDAT